MLFYAVNAWPQTNADAARGQTLFAERCGECHGADSAEGEAQGPDLRGVVGRTAGTDRFGYSPALRRAAFTWDLSRLDRFLENPTKAVPGTTMPLSVPEVKDRRDLVAFLSTLSRASVASTLPRSNRIPSGTAAGATPGVVLLGRAAFGSWRADAPGVRRHIQVADLATLFASPSSRNPARVVDAPPGAMPRVPAGFAVTRFTKDLDGPRLIRVAPNGDIFIAEPASGRIVILRARDGATQPDTTGVYAAGLDRPFGIAFYPAGPHPQWLYVANRNAVVRFPYRTGDLRASGAPESIVARLATTSGGHSTRDIVFSIDGQQMFVSVGSGSNVAERLARRSTADLDQWDAQRGVGAAWGDEENRADILGFDAQGRNGRIYAAGIRNCVGLAVHPHTGDLWCATNERDGLGDDLPPDYVTRVRAGSFFGWPWYYIGSHEDPRHAGERPELANQIVVPDVLLQPHSAPLQVTFYNAQPEGSAAFPVEYSGDAFVTLHGSWNRAVRTGYKVVRIHLNRGIPSGEYEDFLTGFVLNDDQVWGRPVGVAVAHDGALLVSDDGNGTIWRVAYESDPTPIQQR